MTAPSPNDRVRMLRSALQGTLYVYPRGEVEGDRAIFVHLFCDHLKLLYQQPLFVSIWLHRDGAAPAFFTTLRNQDRLFFGLPPLGASGITPEDETHPEWPPIQVGVPDLEGTRLTVVIAPLPIRDLQFERDDLPDWEDVAGFVRDFGKPLARSMAEYGFDPTADLLPDALRPPGPASTPRADLDELYAPLRTQLGRVFRQMRRTQGLRIALEDTEPGAINLFAVVRYRDGNTIRTVHSPSTGVASNFAYTARILLTEDQAGWVRKVVGGADGQNAPALMQAPLGLTSRAVADTVFASGTIDFGLAAERESQASRDRAEGEASELDRKRQGVESKVYGRITKGQNAGIFYVPIHVGGCPWLALFSFQTDSNGAGEDAWSRRFHLYNAAVPVLARQLREAAAQAYAECLAHILENNLMQKGEAAAIAFTNDKWRDAASAYPFARYELTKCPAGDADEVLSVADRHWALRRRALDEVWRDHSCGDPEFRSQVRFADDSDHVVRTRIRTAVARYRAQEDSTMSRAAGAYMTLGHELNKLMGKEFPDAPSRIQRSVEDAEDRDYLDFAWSAVRGVAEIGYLSAKARHAKEVRREELFDQLLGPLRHMQRDGTLVACLRVVAARVYRNARLDSQGVVVPELEDAPRGPLPDGGEFSACYLLTAEPVRNLLHAPPGIAHWNAASHTNSGLRIALTQPGRPTDFGPPRSQTFLMLGDFLHIFQGIARQEFDESTKATTWVVEIPASLLNGRH